MRKRRPIGPSGRKTFTGKKLDFPNHMARDARLKASDFRIGFLITQHVNLRQGFAFPSVARLAKEANTSVSTVKTAIGRLVNAGYFRISRPHRSSTNHYHPNLDVSMLEALSDIDEVGG